MCCVPALQLCILRLFDKLRAQYTNKRMAETPQQLPLVFGSAPNLHATPNGGVIL
jgi:hypothetical protein